MRSYDLGGGVRQLQVPLWRTNVLLAERDGEALVVDPAFRPSELAAIAREAGEAVRHVLVTHGDFDHVCGTGAFPEATVVAGAATAARVRETDVAEAERDWGERWPAPLRVDRVVEPGTFACGPFRVEAVEAADHGVDGLAYALLDEGVLAAGDFLSTLAIPALLGSLEAMTAGCERLLSYVGAHDLRWVVPGHGDALTPEEAHAAGEADLAYLRRVAEVAADARRDGLGPMDVALAVHAVEPPRTAPPDFAFYGERATTARLVAAQSIGR